MDEHPAADEEREPGAAGAPADDPRDPDSPAHEPADSDEAAEIAEGHS